MEEFFNLNRGKFMAKRQTPVQGKIGMAPRPQGKIGMAPRPQGKVGIAPRPQGKVAPKPPPGSLSLNAKLAKQISSSSAIQKKTDPQKMIRILSKDSKGNSKVIRQKLGQLEKIYEITDDFQQTQIPIKRDAIEKIADIANNNDIIMPNEILTILYENRRNVGPLASYLEPRLTDFFNSKKLLPPRGDKLFKVRLLNICVKVKKDKLVFDDEEITNTRKFYDMESLKTSCMLYIWHVKLNECATLNTLDDKDMKFRWNPIVDRLCSIANVPLKRPQGKEAGKDVGEIELEGKGKGKRRIDEDGEEIEEGEEGEGEEGEEKEAGEEGGEKEGGETTEGEEGTPKEEGTAKEESSEVAEEFTENIVEHFNDKDYNFMIATSLFIFFIFLIYNRYR